MKKMHCKAFFIVCSNLDVTNILPWLIAIQRISGFGTREGA
jgi:hypothetical protein